MNESVIAQNIPTCQTHQVQFQFQVVDAQRAELLAENARLRQEAIDKQLIIDTLKLQINTQSLTIQQLEEDNRMLRKELSDMKMQMNKMTDKVDNMWVEIHRIRTNTIMQRLMIVIQDLNRKDLFEQNMRKFSTKFAALRQIRNEDCHYILDHDDADTTLWKKYSISVFLDELTPEVINQFEKKHKVAGIVNAVKAHMNSNYVATVLPPDQMEDHLEFFDGIITIDNFRQA